MDNNGLHGLNVLSLFDGISCGMVALERAGIKVNRYCAYEIEKNAIAISKKNYPNIERHGNVKTADYTQYRGFDLLIGGSPCTNWSCNKNHKAKTPKERFINEGEGWELFKEYLRAKNERSKRRKNTRANRTDYTMVRRMRYPGNSKNGQRSRSVRSGTYRRDRTAFR